MAYQDFLDRYVGNLDREQAAASNLAGQQGDVAIAEPVAASNQENSTWRDTSLDDRLSGYNPVGPAIQQEKERQEQVLDDTGALTKVADTAKAFMKGAGNLPTMAGQALEMANVAPMPEAVVNLSQEEAQQMGMDGTATPGQINPLARGLKQIGKETSDYWTDKMSEGGQLLSGMAWQEAPGLNNKIHAAVLGAAQSAPETLAIGLMGSGVMAATKAGAAAPFLAKGLARLGMPERLAQKGAEWMINGAVYGGAEGLTAGLSGASQVGEQIDKMSVDELRQKSPKFQEYLNKTDASLPQERREAAAKQALKEDAEVLALWATAALSTATGSVAGAGIFDKVLSSKRFLLNRVLVGLKEGHQEFWQSGLGEKLPENLAMRTTDRDVGAMDDVWHEGVAGAGPGAIMGLVAGGGHGQADGEETSGADDQALKRNQAMAQLRRENLPTRDLIAIRNGDFSKHPDPAAVAGAGLQPEHIDMLLDERAEQTNAARSILAGDVHQGPLVRAARIAVEDAQATLAADTARKQKQASDDEAAMAALMGQYNPAAPAMSDQTARSLWPAVEKTPAVPATFSDRTLQGEWDQQELAAQQRNTQAINPGEVIQDKAKGGTLLKRDIPQAEQKLTKKGEEAKQRRAVQQEWRQAMAEFEAGLQEYDPLHPIRGNEKEQRRAFTALAGPVTEIKPRTAPKVDYPSDQEAAQFEEKVRLEQRAKRFKDWSAAFNRKQEAAKKTVEDETIPPEIRRAAVKEADAIVSADSVYAHMAEAKRRGKLNLEAFGQDYGRDTIRQIQRRYPGIFSLSGTVRPDDFADEMGYASLDDMVRRFSEARTKTELAAQIVNDRMGQLRKAEDEFAAVAERHRNAEEWMGREGYMERPDRVKFPATEEEVGNMEEIVRMHPDKFTEDYLDHWTYTAEQQERLKKALRAARGGRNGENSLEAGDGIGAIPGSPAGTGGNGVAGPGRTGETVAEKDRRPADSVSAQGAVEAGVGTGQAPAEVAVGGETVLSGPQTSDNVEKPQQKERAVAENTTGAATPPVDTAAAEAALSPENNLPEPTDGQRKAGNQTGKAGNNETQEADRPGGETVMAPSPGEAGVDLTVAGSRRNLPGNGDLWYTVHRSGNDGRFTVTIGHHTDTRVARLHGKGDTAEAAYKRAVAQLRQDIRDKMPDGAQDGEKDGEQGGTGATRIGTITSEAGEVGSEKKTAAEELAEASDEALTAMLDEVFGEKQPKPRRPKTVRQTLSPNATNSVTPENPAKEQEEPKPAKAPRQITKKGGLAALEGVKSAMAGLNALLGSKNRLGSGLAFDEETYAQAKPHFVKAWNHAKEVGYSLKELLQYFHDQFGKAIRPYLERFLADVKKGDLTVRDATSTVNQRDKNNQPEGGDDARTDNARTGQPDERGTLRQDNAAAEGHGDSALGELSPEVRQKAGEAEPASGRGDKGGGKDSGRDQGADGDRVSTARGGRGRTPKVHSTKRGAGDNRRDGESEHLTDAPATIPGRNFVITPDLQLGKGGEVAKFNDNVAAITTLKQVASERRRATPEEQRILARYVGWGGLANAFKNQATGEIKPGWEDRVAQIEALLTPQELATARSSTQNAHYTSEAVVSAIWMGLQRLGFTGGIALEPSVGTGNFLGLMPQELAGKTRFVAAEFDHITAGIAKLLYPQEAIFHTPFEKLPLPSDEFDLVIGNPPFGKTSLNFTHLPGLNRHSIHNQFFLAGLDALKPGGVQAFVVSRYLLDAKDSAVRQQIARKAKLLGAIRLPDVAFKENARTEVVTDIIFLQKQTSDPDAERFDAAGNKLPPIVQEVPAWIETVSIDGEAAGQEPITVNAYFANNPEMILGKLGRSGSMRRDNDVGVEYTGTDFSGDLLKIIEKALPANTVTPTKSEKSDEVFENMATSLHLALTGEEDGSVSIDDNGNLVHIYEKLSPSGAYLLARRVLTPESPWSPKLTLDHDGRWFEEVDLLDEQGNKVKRVIGGKTTTRNEKTRQYYTEHEVPGSMRLGKAKHARLRDSVGLLSLVKEQIRLESLATSSDEEIEANRKKLNRAYDAFVAKHDHTNSSTVSGVISDVPNGALLLALESSYTKPVSADRARKLGADPRPGSAAKANILSRRVIFPYSTPNEVDSADDALAVNLSETGRVDLEMIASLLGKSEQEIIADLHDSQASPMIFFDPETQTWEKADEYLGGNVVKKLNAAREAGLEKNVEALEKIQPKPWGADKVTVLPGATWVPESVYGDFVAHLTGGPAKVRFQKATNIFFVSASGNTAAAKNWGTDDRGAVELVEAMLNSKTVRVTYTDRATKAVIFDQEASELANMKIAEIKEEFANWIFRDSDRRRLLVDLFNQKYNVRVLKQRNGQHLKLPGKVPDHLIKMRRHQLNAIWRGIVDRFVLYDHAVGAGKTYTGIARAMERRRMGLSRKPMIVVPNHLVEQFAADVYRLYPGAKVLAASKKDLERKKRRRLFAKIATGDWDIVIVPHSSFAFIGIDPETEIRYLEEELVVAEEAVLEAEAEAEAEGFTGPRKPLTVKQAEALRDKIRARLEKLRAGAGKRDRLLTFEQMGIDDLTVDEAHEFKNLFYSSNMQARGMNPRAGSAKAYDLWTKVRTLRESNGSVAFMTGTPISNSAVEMYTMMRYLAADDLADMGIEHFDAWRTQFVDATTEFEPTESGRGLKEVNRLGRDWSNMRALMDLYYSFSDSVSNEDIQRWFREDNPGREFPIPKVKDGGRVGVNVKPTAAQEQILQGIVADFEGLPDIEDIHVRNATRLRLMDAARKVSLDARAISPGIQSDEKGGKLEVVSQRVFDIYRKWNAEKGTQLVFLDRSVPRQRGDKKRLDEYDRHIAALREAEQSGDEAAERRAIEALEKFDHNEMEEIRAAQAGGWNAYQQIKDNLVSMGIPEKEIRFVQDANTDEQKQELFDEVNAGSVRVLIGSTPRMGAGTNVQQRLVALHHVDVTWKPSDIEQREGRIIRQGNLFATPPTEAKPNPLHKPDFEVEILAYTTETTIDAKLWSLNATKLKMINGIRQYNGEFNMEFDDEDSVGMAEIAAIASGDPLQLERVKLDAEIKKLERQQSAFNRQLWGKKDEVENLERTIAKAPGKIRFYKKFAGKVTKARENVRQYFDNLSVNINGKTFTRKGEYHEAHTLMAYLSERAEAEKGKGFLVEIDGEKYRSADKAKVALRRALGDGAEFSLEIDGERFITADDARRHIADLANKAMEGKQDEVDDVAIGRVSFLGLDFDLSFSTEMDTDKEGRPLKIIGFHFDQTGVDTEDMGERITASAGGTVLRINNRVNLNSLGLMFRNLRDKVHIVPDEGQYWSERLEEANRDLPAAREAAEKSFPKSEELGQKRQRLGEVERELAARVPENSRNRQQGPRLSMTGQAVPVADRADIPEEFRAAFGSLRARVLMRQVQVLDSQEKAEALVDRLGESASAKYSQNGAIQGIYANGKVYLVADGIKQGQAVPVLLHEMGEHAARLGFAKDAEYQSILKALEARQDADTPTGEAIRAALARVPKDTKPEHKWSEVAAYLIENNANSKIGIVRRILSFFKKWLFQAGRINADRLTVEDLVLFARSATLAHTGATYTEGVRQSVARVQTATSAFSEWFGASKITKNDQPHILYHGTQHPHFLKTKEYPWVFDLGRPRNPGNADLSGMGIFLGGMDAAEMHAGFEGTVHPFYVRMENPYVTTAAELEKKVEASGAEAFRRRLQDLSGHDGIIIKDRGHVVVFSPNQVKSATDNTGAFSRTDNDVRYSISKGTIDDPKLAAERQRVLGQQANRIIETVAKEGLTGAAEQKLFAAMAKGLDIVDTADADIRTKAWDWFKALPRAAARKSLGGLTLRQLREVFAKNIPQMETFYQASRDIAADANRLMTAADEVYNKWAALDKQNAKSMSELMIRATIAGVNPDVADFEPRALIKRLRAGMDKNLARIAEIRAKGKEATEQETAEMMHLETRTRDKADRIQNEVKRRSEFNEISVMYRRLSPEAKEVYQAVKKQYTDNLNDLFDALEARITRQIKDPKQRKYALDAIRLRYDKYIKEGPYFPLSRFGEYIAIAEKDGGARREVRTFDSMAERTRYARARRAEGWTVQEKTKKEYSRETGGASGSFFEGIVKIIQASEGIDTAERKVLIDEVNQHFIKSMPDLSHRKHFVHRRKVEGYSRDQMRAFADNMQHAAHHIARIRHADKMNTAVESILEESRMLDKNANGDAFVDLHNELNRRLAIMNNPDISPVTQAITAFGFLMNIGPSIASALVNMSQTPLVAFPILATRFKGLGSISAMNALMQASADYFTSKPKLATGPSLVDNKKLPQEERDMIKALIDDGTIDVTQAHSLAQAAGNDYFNLARTKYGHLGARAMRLVSYPFHVAELANRKITALAAYRMARQSGMGHLEAVAQTREAVLDSHFDYSQQNRARWMEGNTRRVLLLFKQYSQQMTWLLGRSFYQAAKGESKEVRQAAAKQLGMILAGHFIVTGAMGMPVLGGMFGTLSFLASLAGDDDEPKDLEVSIRNFLADTFGQTGGDAVMNGPWRMLPGLGQIDLSSRMSLGDLWFRAPNKEMEGRDQFNQYVNLLLGPVATNAANVFMGVNSMAGGEVWRGIEMMLPKAVKDGMKAVRYSTEGVKNWKHDTLLEDLGAVELFGQALGFTPSRVSEMYAGANAVKNHETRLERRRQVLMNRWVNAIRERDTEKAREAMEAITAFNAKNPIFRIDYRKSLVPALKNRMKVQAQTKQGVYVPAKREEVRQVGRFANI